MWPGLMQKAKDGGLDVVETYVFWDVHEPVRGQARSPLHTGQAINLSPSLAAMLFSLVSYYFRFSFFSIISSSWSSCVKGRCLLPFHPMLYSSHSLPSSLLIDRTLSIMSFELVTFLPKIIVLLVLHCIGICSCCKIKPRL